jgi:hypothetical protein
MIQLKLSLILVLSPSASDVELGNGQAEYIMDSECI